MCLNKIIIMKYVKYIVFYFLVQCNSKCKNTTSNKSSKLVTDKLMKLIQNNSSSSGKHEYN